MPKGQNQGGVFDRLCRRIDNYRKRHDDVVPRFENTISNQNQQQKRDTHELRQKFLESSKTKKSGKKSDKKQHSDSGGSSIGLTKSNKRQNEDDGGDGYEPPSKIGGGAGRGNSSPLPSNSTNSSLYKHGFSQNGKRGGNKTKALDSQKYQQASSSSNHPKNGIGRVPQPPPPIPPNTSSFPQCPSTQSTSAVADFTKKESSVVPSLSDFADLDQCAAALEKDAAKNGAITGGFESSSDEIFNSDMLNDLISEISDLNPEVMSTFYLDDGPPTADDLNDVTLHGSGGPTAVNANDTFHPVTPVTPTASSMRSTAVSHGHLSGMKLDGSGGGGVDGTSMGVHGGMDRGLSHCAGPSPAPASTASPLASQLGSSSSHQPSPSQSYTSSHYVLDGGGGGQSGSPLNTSVVNAGNPMTKASTRLPYSSPAGLSVDSPAAQTLKHMAEQHQHKTQQQMCMSSSTAATNGGVTFKNQGSVGSPVGSPYGPIGSYNGNASSSADYSGPGSNCQVVKQEVCSPGNSQSGFSPSPMMVDMASGGKRPGQHNGSSPSGGGGQSSRMPNMNSAGGSPIMSPISKSFNHPSPLNSSNPQGPIPPQQQVQQTQQQQQQQQPPSYMPLSRMPDPSYTNVNPRYTSNTNSQISVASPKSVGSNQGHVSDRGSPATQMDAKSQLRVGIPNQNPQQQQQQFAPQQQFHYGGAQANNIPVEMGFAPGGVGHPQNSQLQSQQQQQQQQQAPPGQTINFTQQHLRMGNQPVTGMPVSRMPMPAMNNRVGVPQRLPGVPMPDPQQHPQVQQQQQQQQRPPMMDNGQMAHRMMRPPPQGQQHPRHNMMPTHQQMQMGAMSSQPQNMQQMNSGPVMGNPMMNRFPGMSGNPQMIVQQQSQQSQQQQQHQQSYNMGGNMPMPGGPNNGVMPMRRPYGPGFQGMNPRAPSDQMLSSAGSQNPHNTMGNPGVPHNDWMSNMNTMGDGSCPPYARPPQRHSNPQQQMRPAMPPQQFHSGMPPNQAAPGQGPSQMTSNFNQPHDHMMGQQPTNYPVAAPNHSQQQQLHHHQQSQQQQQQQQLPPNFSQHPSAGGPNSMKMGMPPGHHHPQQQQPPPPMYGNQGFGMKPPDNNGMMCPPQNSMLHHHQQMQQQQQPPPPPQQQQHMYMGNMMSSGGGGQMSNSMGMSDHQEFDLNLLVDGMRGSGEQAVDPAGFNDTADLLSFLT